MTLYSEAYFSDRAHNPAEFFEGPGDVLRDSRLTMPIKIEILDRWEHDERGLMVSDEEGMTGGVAPRLDQIRQALHEIRGPHVLQPVPGLIMEPHRDGRSSLLEKRAMLAARYRLQANRGHRA